MRLPARQSTRRHGFVLLACSLGLLLANLNTTVVAVALSDIQSSLRTTTAELQWVVNSYQVVAGGLLFSAGTLADRLGKRRIYVTGLLLFAAGSAAASAATDTGALIFVRCVQGAGGAVLTPVTLAIVAEAYTDPASRAKAIGVWTSAVGLGTAAGPLIGGALIAIGGWRAVFVFNTGVALMTLGFAIASIPRSSPRSTQPLDPTSQALAILGLAGIVGVIIMLGSSGHPTRSRWLLLTVTLSAVTAFALRQWRSATPLFDPRLLMNAGYVAAACAAFCIYLAYSGFTFFNAIYLQRVHGLSPLGAGVWILPSALAAFLCAFASGRLTARWGTHVPLALGMLFLSGGLAVLASVQATATLGVLLFLAYVGLGAGLGLANAPTSTAALSSVPRDVAGSTSGVIAASRMAGGSVGLAIVTAAVMAYHGGDLPRRGAGDISTGAFIDGMNVGYVLCAVPAAVVGLAAAAVLYLTGAGNSGGIRRGV